MALAIGAAGLGLLPAMAAAPKPAPYSLEREVVTQTATAGGPEDLTALTVECPTGKVPVGGGYSISFQPGSDAGINSLGLASYPDGSAWVVRFSPDGQGARDELAAYAVCVAAAAATN